ncbi:MAG: hypothetical protein JF565_05485 [Propionibacteriales bacterium]|jgi:hypothetical protein|nr:hypothetical protein [Propionibacteriales bacterium]
MPVRLPLVAVVLVLGVTLGVVAVATLSAPPREESVAQHEARPTAGSPAAERSALTVLHEWDARRAIAWAAGDASAVRGLYTPGSAAGAADARLLGRYRARGLVVRDLRMQVLRARVLVTRPSRLELEVTDRVAGATAVRADDVATGRRLPADRPSTHVLVLRRVDATWLMASVSAKASSRSR